MKKATPLLIFILSISYSLSYCQVSNPVWDIGTKWTYEYNPSWDYTTFVTNEIIDTTTIDGLKLYQVATNQEYTGISYFYFEDGKVYNYNTTFKILQLLYDFENTSYYSTNYRPICDPDFDADTVPYYSYQVNINSITDFQLPDGLISTVQHTNLEGPRRILKNIGFMEGYIHHTHDWELGMYICDEFGNYVRDLRCFENDSVFYNFKDYPCDTTWFLSTTQEVDLYKETMLYPNPTSSGNLNIKNFQSPQEYQVYNLRGQKIQSGICKDGTIELTEDGINIVRLKGENESWEYYKILNLSNSR